MSNINGEVSTISSKMDFNSDLPMIDTKEPLSTLQSFRQPKTFVANTGVNPLVAASAALFSLVVKLGQTHRCQDIDKLRNDLIYEIKAFESNACAEGYSPDVILLARFALCATLDEIIKYTPWGKQSQLWKEKNLLAVFQGDGVDKESFFLLLEKLQTCKNFPVDLLEMVYICLSLGFLGKSRLTHEEQKRLENLLDSYYQRIRFKRPDISGILSDTAKITRIENKTKVKPISIWLIFFITSLLLACIYSGFNYMLSMTTAPLYSKLDKLTTTLNYEKTA